MFGEARKTPGEVLAPVIEPLEPANHVERKRLVAFECGSVGLVAKPSKPPEPGKAGSLAQNDHQQREDGEAEEPDGGPADPILPRHHLAHEIVQPDDRGEPDETAHCGKEDAAPAPAALERRQSAHGRRQLRRVGGDRRRRQRRIDDFDLFEPEGCRLAWLGHVRRSPISAWIARSRRILGKGAKPPPGSGTGSGGLKRTKRTSSACACGWRRAVSGLAGRSPGKMAKASLPSKCRRPMVSPGSG